MIYKGKIPVVVGVTGHRDIDGTDREELKREVKAALGDVRAACVRTHGEQSTPIIMLNAFAQGADMLCAEAAFEMGIDVCAVLPCEEHIYAESFTDPAERAKLSSLLNAAKRVITAPDVEQNRAWLAEQSGMSERDYEYRQAGIYIAEHAHIVLALWDGNPPREKFGCGTVEVIKFALEHKYSDGDHLFHPGILNDTAVLWINARKSGSKKSSVQRRWLVGQFDKEENTSPYGDYFVCDGMPEYIGKIISKTVAYNGADGSCNETSLWKSSEELDEYRKTLACHYSKADELSFNKNQKYYNLFILLVAILGTFVAFAFMLYDDASLTFMILPCALAVCVLLWLIWRGRRMDYQTKYIEYRAFAEAFRIQFYMSMCLKETLVLSNVCRLYSWTQKVDSAWIYKALQAVAAINASEALDIQTSRIIDVWIGNSNEPKGQLRYHSEKLKKNKRISLNYDKLTLILNIVTIAIYAFIFVIEIVNHILDVAEISWFWEGEIVEGLSWRSVGIIVMGTATAASLLFTSYFGKLSFGRKAEDNLKMSMFYTSAYARWEEAKLRPAADIAKFVREIAREEIVENGIWCSYARDNHLEINI